MDDPKNPVLNPTDPGVTPGQAPSPADPSTPTPLVPDAPPAPPPDAPLPPMPEPPMPPAPETGPPTPPAGPAPPGGEDETPPTDVPTPEDQPSEGGLPPVISPPTTGPKAKLIASIIGLVLLVVSIPAGIILVGRQQEIREKAAENCIEQVKTVAKSRGAPENRLNDIANDVCGRGTLESFKAGADTGVIYGVGQATTPIHVAPAAKVGVGQACSKQEDCQDNLTCNPAPGTCKINSGQGNCCGTDDQCKNFGKGGGKCAGSDPLCQSGKTCVETGSATDPTTGQSTPNIERVGLGQPCQNQTQCQDNLTCKDNVCKLNSLQGNCCDLDSHCAKFGATSKCAGTDSSCLSGKACLKSETAAAPSTGGGGGPCAVTGIDVYKYPFAATDKVTSLDNAFKAGDLVRFVVNTSDDTKATKVEVCEVGYSCGDPISKRDMRFGPQRLYRDIRLGNVGSVTIKARCAF